MADIFDIDPRKLRMAIESTVADSERILIIVADDGAKVHRLANAIVVAAPATEDRVYTAVVAPYNAQHRPFAWCNEFCTCRNMEDVEHVARCQLGREKLEVIRVHHNPRHYDAQILVQDVKAVLGWKRDGYSFFGDEVKWSPDTHSLQPVGDRAAIKTLMLARRKESQRLHQLPLEVMFEIFARV